MFGAKNWSAWFDGLAMDANTVIRLGAVGNIACTAEEESAMVQAEGCCKATGSRGGCNGSRDTGGKVRPYTRLSDEGSPGLDPVTIVKFVIKGASGFPKVMVCSPVSAAFAY